MNSWEKWQAAQGAPPTQAPTAAFNQNDLPSNNGTHPQPTAESAPAQSAPTHSSHCVGGGAAPSHQQTLNQNNNTATPAVGDDGMRILSADEVKKELNAMDPETRQKTIEMGNKLKDIVQAAIDIYSITPNLSSSLLKEKILEKVGPMPVNEIDLPVHALKVLYAKLYGKAVPPEHEAPLEALSTVFSPQHAQHAQEVKKENKEKIVGADSDDVNSKERSTAAAAAAVDTTKKATAAAGAAATAGAPGGKKLGVSREQYEKLLSRMNPEERKKHPKYDQVMKQYEQMDVSEKQRTQEAANKLRDFMKYSVQLYLGNPALTVESYRRRMTSRFGTVPDYPQWHLVTYTHLCTMYETINNVSHQTPHVMAALRALSQILPRAPPTTNTTAPNHNNTNPNNVGAPGGAAAAAAAAAARFAPPQGPAAIVQQLREQDTRQHLSQGHYQHHNHHQQQHDQYDQGELEEEEEEMDVDGMAVGNYPEPDYNNLPEELNVSCNGKNGIFFVRTQTMRCLCEFCAETAEALKLPFLNISVNEFERHCGMGQSKKWKYTIRVMDPLSTLGQWMDENGFNIKYTKGQPDDIKLKRAEKKREKEAAAVHRNLGHKGPGGGGGGDGGYNMNNTQSREQQQQPQQQQVYRPASAFTAPTPTAAAAAPAAPPAPAANNPPVSVNRRKATLVKNNAAAAGYHHSGDESTDIDRNGAADVTASGRAQRQRKQPTWMKQTIDPNAALGGKALVQRQINGFNDDDDDVPVLRGAGQLHPARTRPYSSGGGDGSRGGVPKRPRVDPDVLLEAEIDAALSRGLQPEVHGWRVDDTNQLNVTVHLGGVVFSGVLPARVPREASSPAILAAVLQDQRIAHAIAPVPPPSAVVSRPPLPVQRQRNVASAYDSGSDGAGAGGGSYDDDMDDLPPVPPTAVRTISSALGIDPNAPASIAAAVAASVPVGGAAAVVIESAVNKAVQKELRMDERRAEAASEYDRLLVEGPPQGAKCAMCHLEEVDTVPRGTRDPSTGKSQVGLGGLVLVRTSAVTNAWVHDQCARWSPDVYDPTGEGILEGIAVAVRRGRMLRCKTCGQKGATLGCLKRTCKCSFHLPCAREHGCLLNMEPYAVACPEHVDQLPDGLSQKLGFKKGKRARSESVPAPMPPLHSAPGPPSAPSGGGGGGGMVGASAPQGGYPRSLNALGALVNSMNPPPPPPPDHYMPPQ